MSGALAQPGASQAIPFASVKLALFAHKMRRANGGRTAQMAAVPRVPINSADCGSHNRNRPQWREVCRRGGLSGCTFVPLHRGGIGDLIERTRLNHGLAEVRKTWGMGIRALLAEPRYVLNGGAR